jgi:hypothetical protein
VQVEEVIGDPRDLVGEPLVEAECVVSRSEEEDCPKPANRNGSLLSMDYVDSYTWTFYKFGTKKGFVTVRWLGESNGYYSEDVDLELMCAPTQAG